ncbi:DUF6268 family outer membrane beta-barrel protein [Siansivirga zeaxanthinifaciens]|uniref:DUF6268 family outer membrane beta-barrel protein n=1 Tax=Siansivirga zeaxanthinifaciens TaxID=762954 RepID=UPI0005CB9D89|nr:DUF6268 family outer membrane beta-barrel protein [Siansivirga zeaxanthinifaciens]
MDIKELKIVIVILVLCVSNFGYAQLTDIARLEYSFVPKNQSEDQYTRLRALFNYPVKIKNKDYLVLGAEYNRILLNLEDHYPFDKSSLSKIHVVDLNIGYTFKWNETWRFGAKFNPRLASTLTRKITSQDFFMNGGVFFINDRLDDETAKHPYRLILGLTYNATTGLPFPLPFVSYFRPINEKWSYNAGVPKSNIKYAINYKNSVQVFVGLDGYLAHIHEPIMINGQTVDNISLSVAVAGLGYEYEFTNHLIGYAYTGYTFRLNNVLRDKNRNEIFTLDDLNAFYLRTGIKFKI